MFDRVDKLMEELGQMPIVELLGVVDPGGGGVGGGHGVGEKDWFLHFAFDSWKYVDGALQNRKLDIRKKVSLDELKFTMQQVAALDVLHVQARVAEQNSFGTPQGLLVNIIRKDLSDDELQQRVTELRRPFSFKDSRFGVFILNRRINWFEAEVAWGSIEIRLALKVGEGGDPKECLDTAHALWNLQSVWSKRVTDLAIAELLDLKNRAWLEDDENPLTAEQFLAAIRLTSITVAPDGSFDFWHNDGDLFFGHDIKVSGSITEGPTSAGIVG